MMGCLPSSFWSTSSPVAYCPVYSDYGYYLLTENDNEPLTVDSAAFLAACYPSNNDYHTLYEVDDFAWYHGGRNLYDKTLYKIGTPQTYTLKSHSTNGTLTVVLSYDGNIGATIAVNDSVVEKINVTITLDNYTEAAARTWTYRFDNLKQGDNTVTITQTSGSNLRLDYLALTNDVPSPKPDLAANTFAVPEFVHRIGNQDHHADEAVDMVILIPTSQKWLSQAERIKTLHETRDGLKVRIVPADELYNEFSSGTPDATAYRRYMKMLYDRATTDEAMPRFLLLFGDGAYDNRMLTSEWNGYDPDDFLLCFESDNSFSHVYCYVSDDFYGLLDDNVYCSIMSAISFRSRLLSWQPLAIACPPPPIDAATGWTSGPLLLNSQRTFPSSYSANEHQIGYPSILLSKLIKLLASFADTPIL